MRYLTNLEFSFLSSNCVVGTICAFGLLAFMVGCDSAGVNTESVLPQTEEAINPHFGQPSVVDGRIAFDDFDEFRDFMGSIIDKEDSHLDSIQAVINFTSLRSDTERLADEVGKDVEELEVVEDPFFATALNSDGEIQIGDMVYKVTRDHVYRVLESNVGQLSSIPLRNQNDASVLYKSNHGPDVEVFQVERQTLLGKSDFYRRRSCAKYFTTNDPRRRVRGQAWVTNFLIFSSATTEIEYQKKSWGRWRRIKTTWVSLDAEYSVSYAHVGPNGISVPVTKAGSYSHTKYNASEIRKNLSWAVPYRGGFVVMGGRISSTYTARRSDSMQGSCSTSLSR